MHRLKKRTTWSVIILWDLNTSTKYVDIQSTSHTVINFIMKNMLRVTHSKTSWSSPWHKYFPCSCLEAPSVLAPCAKFPFNLTRNLQKNQPLCLPYRFQLKEIKKKSLTHMCNLKNCIMKLKNPKFGSVSLTVKGQNKNE